MDGISEFGGVDISGFLAFKGVEGTGIMLWSSSRSWTVSTEENEDSGDMIRGAFLVSSLVTGLWYECKTGLVDWRVNL